MEEYIEIKERIIKQLKQLKIYRINEKILNAIIYEFYTQKEYYEDKYNVVISPNFLGSAVML